MLWCGFRGSEVARRRLGDMD